MSSINEGYKFILGNVSSDELGLSLASSFGSVSRSGNVENRTIITTKNLNETFNFHGVKYDNPLQFDIIVFNTDGSWIDCNQERIYKKCLLKNKRQWFQIDQDDLADIQFYVIGVSAEIIDVGSYSGGMKITFQADSPWAYSDLKKKIYTTVNGSLSFSTNLNIDFDEYCIYPTLEIKSLGDGDIVIHNNTTNETITISDCINNEAIVIQCSSDKVSSTASNIINRWSKTGISMVDGKNDFLLTGAYSVTMSYRLPIRVGA